jgi:hypothetical protein
MATFNSQPYQYGEYISQYPVELIGKSLLYKQEKYDVNRQKLQDFYNRMNMTDFYKKEDREYFQQRLSVLSEEVNKAGAGDLSIAANLDGVTGHLSQATDERVINGYLGTQQIRQYQQEFEKLREKDPKNYNDLNYQYGLVNAQKWAQDGKSGTRLDSYKDSRIGAGIGRVTPYRDTMKELQEAAEKISPDIKVVQTEQGLQFIDIYNKTVSDSRLRNLVEMKMQDSGFSEQMNVNAWGQYRGMDDGTFKSYAKINLETQKTQLQDQLSTLQTEATKLTGAEKQKKDAEINMVSANMNAIQNRMVNLDVDLDKERALLERNMHAQELTNNFVDTYGYSQVTDIKYHTNEAKKLLFDHNLQTERMKLKNQYDKAAAKQKESDDLLKLAYANATKDPELAQLYNQRFKGLTGTEGQPSPFDRDIAATVKKETATAQIEQSVNKAQLFNQNIDNIRAAKEATGIGTIDRANEIINEYTATKKSGKTIPQELANNYKLALNFQTNNDAELISLERKKQAEDAYVNKWINGKFGKVNLNFSNKIEKENGKFILTTKTTEGYDAATGVGELKETKRELSRGEFAKLIRDEVNKPNSTFREDFNGFLSAPANRNILPAQTFQTKVVIGDDISSGDKAILNEAEALGFKPSKEDDGKLKGTVDVQINAQGITFIPSDDPKNSKTISAEKINSQYPQLSAVYGANLQNQQPEASKIVVQDYFNRAKKSGIGHTYQIPDAYTLNDGSSIEGAFRIETGASEQENKIYFDINRTYKDNTQKDIIIPPLTQGNLSEVDFFNQANLYFLQNISKYPLKNPINL